MKCINNHLKYLICILLIIASISGCSKPVNYVIDYEIENYNKNLHNGKLFATNLAVANENIELTNHITDNTLNAVGLFDINGANVLHAENIHERLYPASTTKLLTAYITLKYGNLSDVVTVSENATNFEAAAQVCGLKEGDELTLEALLNGLLLYSGNDNAVAIAEHISGSVEEFATLMNEEAKKLGVTNSNFMNPHGLHEDNHYTTAYDLYLIFNACMQDERFIHIIEQKSYTATINNPEKGVRKDTWLPTNYYSLGKVPPPENVNVIGGKTGTTDEAGACVILLFYDEHNNPYISIMMGANSKDLLYQDMTSLILALPPK